MFSNQRFSSSMREKRMHFRKTVVARVRISHSTFGVIHTRTRNISDGGVYLELYNPPHLPVGAHIKMHMLDSAMPEIAFNMRVVRVDEFGVSLAFVDYEMRGERYNMATLELLWQRQSHLDS